MATRTLDRLLIALGIDAGELSRINTGVRPLLRKHAETIAAVLGQYGVQTTAGSLIRAQERYIRSLAPSEAATPEAVHVA